ncbi:hypothetical protein [Azospira restricta]|nr:hypothetical protein [Azospira restricta]
MLSHAITRLPGLRLAVVPRSAPGWLRFGVTALPKTAPPLPAC